MPSLRELTLKATYDPARDGQNTLDGFLLPCLKRSVSYDRLSAYFSSAALKVASKGIKELIANGGKIRFIFSSQIEESEMRQIREAYHRKMDGMAEELTNDPSLKDDFEIANLSYLIESGLAEVKIAFMLNTASSICHTKLGVFKDDCGGIIAFTGSGNETEAGLLRNAEIFSVFNNFEGADPHLEDAVRMFESIWDNTYSPSTMVAVYPDGRLFQTLMSYSRHRVVESEEDLCEQDDSVLIDVDDGRAILTDRTTNRKLRIPAVLSSYLTEFEAIAPDAYYCGKANAHLIRDIIVGNLKDSGVNFHLSLRARLFLEQYDYKLSQRVKLASAIKSNQGQELWLRQYVDFKEIVNNNTSPKYPLKERQMRNAFFHSVMKSSADFSVPGTGKTFISYGLFAYLQHCRLANRIVVFGPLNCFLAWKEEASKIFEGRQRLSFFDIAEHQGDRQNELKRRVYDCYLFNYEWLNSPAKSELLSKYVLTKKTLLVFDEIHKLKAIDGFRSNMFLTFLRQTDDPPIYRLALTGTPLPNSYTDLSNCLNYLFPDDMAGDLASLSPLSLKQADKDQEMAGVVRKTLYPLFVRTTKSDLGVPPPEPDDLQTLSCIPSEQEANLYQAIWKSGLDPLAKYIRLIQASSNPSLLQRSLSLDDFSLIVDDPLEINLSELEAKTEIARMASEIPLSGKMRKSIDFLASEIRSGKKIIVWCLFIDTIDLVARLLEEKGIEAISICGRDSQAERQGKINRFKNGGPMALLTNPNTLAESVSLHTVCHEAVYLEYGFNLTYLLQSKDRINRVGLREGDKTNYYFALSGKARSGLSSLDAFILERLKEKENRMLSVIESDDLIAPVNMPSDIDDIKQIIADYEAAFRGRGS